jgi:hypothetical protein
MCSRSINTRVCLSLAYFISYGALNGYVSGEIPPPAAASWRQFQVDLRIVRRPDLDPRFVAFAASELIALWRPLGVDVVQFTGTPRPQPSTAVTMVFVDGLPLDRSAGTLGWVGFEDTKTAAPLIFVSVAAVRRLVEPISFKGAPFLRIPQAGRDRLIARAVGRTAAHELGHFLLSSRSHTPTGLMRDRFPPQELIEEYRSSFRLENPQRTILAARIFDGQFLTAASFAPPPDR